MKDSPSQDDRTQLEDCVARGRRLWTDLDTRVGGDVPDLGLRPYAGMYHLNVERNALSPLDSVEGNILRDLGELPSLQTWTKAEVFSWDSNGVAYNNYMDRTGQALLCAFNDKSWDKNGFERMPFDNMLARVMADVTTRDCISNLQWEYRPGDYPDFVDVFPHDKNGEPDPVFFGLLGTPNVKGIVRLLTNFANLFGRKTIAKIRTTTGSGGSPTLVICLQAVDRQVSGTAQEEEGRRSSGSKRRMMSDGAGGLESKRLRFEGEQTNS